MADTFSPYQIDYNVKNTSKTFGFSKKKVTFKFGVANNDAIAQGMTGANCRGSEHEVIFIWSLNSGKRQILADGKDVHYSETGQNGWTADQVFQHHFAIRVPGLSAPLRAHLITQPANRDVPQIKPFDLRINGLSYFSMCRIFQLGTPKMTSRPVGKKSGRGSSRGGGEDDAYMSPEERQAIAAAKLASLRDLQDQQNRSSASAPAPSPSAPTGDLINFLDDPAPPPPPVGAPQGQPQYEYASNASFGAPPPGAAPPAAAPYGQQPYSNYTLGGSMGGLPSQQPPQQQASYSNMQFASQSSFGSAPPPPPQQFASQSSFGSAPPPPPAASPAQPFGQPPSNSMTASYPPQQYGYQQQAPPPMQQQPFGAPPSQPSPSNQTMASYQSYGSAPTFAQPPQQQQPSPQQQYQQQPQYQQYGAPPPQGYPQY